MAHRLGVGLDEIDRRRKASGLSADRMESEGKEFFERVRRGYLAIAAEEPARIRVIDGAAAIESIGETIWGDVAARFTPGRGL